MTRRPEKGVVVWAESVPTGTKTLIRTGGEGLTFPSAELPLAQQAPPAGKSSTPTSRPEPEVRLRPWPEEALLGFWLPEPA